MADMSKIMIIGAGAGQVPIIRAAKRRGLETVVVSPYGPYPGIDEADTLVPIDIYDKPAVLEAAKREKIDYVISDQSDFAVPTVAYVAENLGLVGNSIATAEIYSDKGCQRRFCQENGLMVPSAFTVSCEDDLLRVPFGFPWVVKPVDSQGSRGVCRVDNHTEVIDAFRDAMRYTKKETVVVEEFFEGREVVCEGFVIDGVYHNVAFADREYFNIPGKFIPSKTIFPSSISEDAKHNMIQQDALFARKANARFGIIHSEYLVNEYGDFRLVETALRGGGVYISSHLIPMSTGLDLTELLLDYLLQGPDSVASQLAVQRKSVVRSAAYVCFYLESGTVSTVRGLDEIRKNPNVQIADVDKVVSGFCYQGLKHKGDRLGPFVVAGDTRDELMETVRDIQSKYVICMNSLDEDVVVWN